MILLKMLLFRSLGFLVWGNFSFTEPGFVFGPISTILSGSNSIRIQLHSGDTYRDVS
jgi:hypothetical protein